MANCYAKDEYICKIWSILQYIARYEKKLCKLCDFYTTILMKGEYDKDRNVDMLYGILKKLINPEMFEYFINKIEKEFYMASINRQFIRRSRLHW